MIICVGVLKLFAEVFRQYSAVKVSIITIIMITMTRLIFIQLFQNNKSHYTEETNC